MRIPFFICEKDFNIIHERQLSAVVLQVHFGLTKKLEWWIKMANLIVSSLVG